VQLGRFEEAFLRGRCRALARFLQRVSQNKELVGSPRLTSFLTADDATFAAAKTEVKQSTAPGVVADTREQMGFWFQSAMSSASSSITRGIKQMSGEATVEEPRSTPSAPSAASAAGADPWAEDPDLLEFASYEEFATKLENNLTNVSRHAGGILVRQREWSASLAGCGETFKGLSDAETDRTSPLFHELGFSFEQAGKAGEGSSARLLQAFVEPLQDAARFVRGIKVALHQRLAARKAAHQASTRLRSRQKHLNELRARPADASKVPGAEGAVTEAEQWLAQATAHVALVTDRLRQNMVQFKEQYLAEVKAAMQNYATLQLKMAQDLAQTWESSLGSFENAASMAGAAMPAADDGDDEAFSV